MTTTPTHTASPRIKILVAFSALIMLLIALTVIYQVSQGYEESIQDGRATAERRVRSQADHVELTFLSVDLILKRVVERQYFNALFGNTLPRYLLQHLQLWVNDTPPIAAMIVVNAKGEGVVAAHKKGYADWIDYARTSFSRTEFFTALKQSDPQHPLIHAMPANTQNGKHLILVSRRLTRLNGEFDGIAVAMIDPDYFKTFFHSVEGMQGQHTLLLGEGGKVVGGSHETAKLLTSPVLKDVRAQLAAVDAELLQTTTHMFTHHDTLSLYALHRIRSLPLSLVVVLEEGRFLGAWQEARRKQIGFLLIFMVFGAVLLSFALVMARQILRAQESEASAILASQAKSEFLANMSHELRHTAQCHYRLFGDDEFRLFRPAEPETKRTGARYQPLRQPSVAADYRHSRIFQRRCRDGWNCRKSRSIWARLSMKPPALPARKWPANRSA